MVVAVGEVHALVAITRRRGVPSAARPSSTESAPSVAVVEEARALVAIVRRSQEGAGATRTVGGGGRGRSLRGSGLWARILDGGRASLEAKI